MSSPVINWQTTVPITLATSADVCHLYPVGDPGNIHCRPCPVVLTPHGIAHLSAHDPTRMAWLQPRAHLIIQALIQPRIIYSALDWKSRDRVWSQFLAVPDTLGSAQWVAVAVSLAPLTGNPSMHLHRVITIFAAKESYLFAKNNAGLVLKPKWIWT